MMLKQYLSLILQSIFVIFSFVSCNDEIEYKSISSDEITFAPTTAKGWYEIGNISRSKEYDNTFVHVSVTEGECDTYSSQLYLHTVVSEQETTSLLDNDISSSRANPTTKVYDNICVTGLYVDPSGNETFLMKDENVESPFDKTGRYWPNGDGKVTFYAHSPYHAPGLSSSFPELVYKVPLNPKDQTDILIGKSETYNLPDDKEKAVEIPLHHALTAVQFVASPSFEAGEIESMKVKNICDSATFDYNSLKWNLTESRESFTVMFDNPIKTGKDTVNIFTHERTLMMIPQSFNEENNAVELEIVFYDNLPAHNKHIVKFELKDSWKSATNVKYCISTNPKMIERVFESNLPQVNNFNYEGKAMDGTLTNFYIKSYSVYADESGEHYQKLDYIEPSFPSWIECTKSNMYENVDENTNEGVGCYTYTITKIDEGEYSDFDEHNTSLRALDELKHVVNLSNQASPKSNEVINTANCYVINAPGTYKFPIVMGNGIKNGILNKEAYTNPTSTELGTAEKYFMPIVDYTGKSVDINPIIKNAVSVDVIWQDSENLATNIKLSRDNNYDWISFNVTKENIAQGNAVIIAKDIDDIIIWSWHIWVTDYDINDENNIFTVGDFGFLNNNIGWCDGKSKIYKGRDYKLLIPQNETGKTIESVFYQLADTIIQKGNSTYYQWGRKDPFPGMIDYGQRKTIYGNIIVDKDRISNGNGIEMSIRNPNTFYSYKGKTWYTYDISADINKCPTNAWNTSAFNKSKKNNQYISNRTVTIKSIYDPCPIGFKVPPIGAFENSRSLMIWDNDQNAYIIKSGSNYLNFYAIGYLIADESAGAVGELWRYSILGTQLRYWSSELDNQGAGHLCYKTSVMKFSHSANSFVSQAFPIKAVVDESITVK